MGYGSIEEIFKSGLSGDALQKAVSEFYAAGTKASYNSGKTKSKDEDFDSGSTGLGLDAANAKATTLTGIFDDATTAGSEMFKALNPTDFSGADYLMKSGQELANQMGIGKARIGEMRTTIADTIPEMLKLGLSSTEAFSVLKDVPVALGVNTTLGTEALVEMGAAAKVSGVETKTLALEFKNVGISLYDVGNRMAEVANYAKSVGANVQAVSGLVVSNLKQLSLFNFDSGVKGLGKMASEATMLGFSMSKTFALAEKLLSPEKAIEMAASLQSLGVSSSALLDPLKAMDLAQNDPEALQKEIINVSKEFTKLKADGSGFEILPGAKRRLREVAQAIGMDADELANMSIKSADLDMKMSKIKFPSLAASQEDKMLIANMSQMKNGEAVVQIKNEKTGAMDEINVSKLTADQITKLKEQQSDQNKTIEELALDQLNVLESIDAGINGAKAAVNLGKASTPAMDRFYNTMNVIREESVKGVTSGVKTGNVRDAYRGVSEPIETGAINLLKGDTSLENLNNTLNALNANMRETFGTLVKGGASNLIQAGQNTVNRVTDIYSETGKVEATNIKVDQNSPIVKQFQDIIDQIKTGGPVETKTQVSGEVTHNFNIKGDGVASLTQEEFNKFFLEAYTNPTIKSKVDAAYGTSNSGLLTK